jgi:hypothetical protein
MLQSVLLIMCLFWKKRQARLGIDDFGRPLSVDDTDGEVARPRNDGVDVDGDERTPLLANTGSA